MVRVSVVIPSHDAERYLAQTIGSALDQSLAPHEVIIVDDGSTDASLRIARQFEARYPDRVKVFSEHHHNAPRVRNLGAMVATGDALMFLDADDVLRPDALQALAEALATQQAAVAICPWSHLHLRGGRWVEGPPSCAPRRPAQDPLSAWLTGWYHPPVSVLWSREAFERAGRWDERCGQNQDGDLMMRALVLGVPLATATEGLGFYRRMPQGPNLETVTGKRYTPHGVSNLIYVTRKIAWLAEQTGQLDRYRPALRRSFATIAGIATKHGHLELAEQARAGVQLYQQPWELLVSWGGRNQLRRAYLALRQRLRAVPPQGPADQDDPGEEVDCGLAVAELASAVDTEAIPPAARVDHPSVSIIVVSLDGTPFGCTVSGVLEQLDDVEVLLVHPGGTGEVGEVDPIHHPHVRHVPCPPGEGVNAARNRGLRSARGDIIALRDADDLHGLAELGPQVQRLQREPENLGLVATGVEPAAMRQHLLGSLGGRARDRDRDNPVPTQVSGVAFRRSVIASIGFFDEADDTGDPAEYWSRVPRFFAVDTDATSQAGRAPGDLRS